MPEILDHFRDNVSRLGDAPCFWYKSGSWLSLSWNEVSSAVGGYAKKLTNLGVKPGDTVGIISSTRVEWTIADLAILSIGAITVPVYPSLTSEQIAYILKDADVKVVFVEDSGWKQKLPAGLKALLFSELTHLIKWGERPARGLAVSPQAPLARTGKARSSLASLPQQWWTGIEPSGQTATIIYTSGTTGEPKGVVITYDNILAEVEALKKVFMLGADEVMFSFLPLAHVLARASQFFQLSVGCQAAYATSMESIAGDLVETRPHMTVVVPRVMEKIYEKVQLQVREAGATKRALFNWSIAGGQEYFRVQKTGGIISLKLRMKYFLAKLFIFSKLCKALGGRMKFIISGGAPLGKDIAEFFASVGLLVLEGYGLTETLAGITVNRPNDFHLGTVGKPLDGVMIKLADDGEILVKGGMVFKEYFKRDEETNAAFTGDGWFKTGDVGKFSRDGFLRITDRKKEIIVTAGGKNIAPQAVENIFKESPYISNIMVHGDKRKFLSALVTLNNFAIKGYASEKIKDLISSVINEKNRSLAGFETVKKFTILEHDFTVETGELTPTMKLKRRVIEEKYRDVLDKMYEEG